LAAAVGMSDFKGAPIANLAVCVAVTAEQVPAQAVQTGF